MIPQIAKGAGSAARAGFGWWTGEIAAMLPRRLAGRSPDPLIVTAAPDGVSVARRAADGSETAVATPNSARAAPLPATLQLPVEMVLARTITLAAAAEENLHEVVGFQLDRFTPFEADEVYLGCRVVGRDPDAEAITVAIAVAPKPEVDALVQAAAQRGLACTSVVAANAFERGDIGDLPLEFGVGRATPGQSRRLTPALSLVALALAIACVAVPLARGHAQLSELEREVASMRREAQAVATLRNEVEERSEQAAIPLQRWQRTPLSTLVAELTRLVPDSGWVTQLEIDAGSVQLTGYAAAANALIPALEASPILTNAAFRSPVTQDQVHGVEQFHLSVDLRSRNE